MGRAAPRCVSECVSSARSVWHMPCHNNHKHTCQAFVVSAPPYTQSLTADPSLNGSTVVGLRVNWWTSCEMRVLVTVPRLSDRQLSVCQRESVSWAVVNVKTPRSLDGLLTGFGSADLLIAVISLSQTFL